MTFTIKRISSTPDGVFGVMLFDGVPFAVTAERPWLNNKPDVSCIPEGEYWCHRVKSPKFGDTFEIMNVPGRSKILFHKGNVPTEDSLGCILIGEQFEPLHGKAAVLASKHGYGEYKKMIEGLDSHYLKIENHF
jgi:hypothetical protein